MPTSIQVKDATGASVTIATLDAISALMGEAADAPTANTMLARLKTIAENVAGLNAYIDGLETLIGATNTALNTIANATEYETVAASQTDQALGATGATGDLLAGVLIVPASTSPGAVSIKDGAGSAITVFAGGASSLSNLVPFYVPLGVKSAAGAWSVTTGASVSVVAAGNFS